MKKIFTLTLMSFACAFILGCSNGDEKTSNTDQKKILNKEADTQYSKDAEEKSRESRFKWSEKKVW